MYAMWNAGTGSYNFFTWILLEINVGMVFGLRNVMSTTFSQQIICNKLLQVVISGIEK